MADRCPLCGALTIDGQTCRDRYDLALVKEFADPAYGAVHHLTVPAYTLQHNGYSRDGWLSSRALLAEFVHSGLTPATARQKYRNDVDSGNRDWSITRGPKFERFGEITWTRTIADVRFEPAEAYRADVRAWAEAVLADAEAVAG